MLGSMLTLAAHAFHFTAEYLGHMERP